MTRRSAKIKPKDRGTIDKLASGALRVRVNGGIDPSTKRRIRPTKVIPAGPEAQKEAEKALTRMLNEVDERRHPRTSATVAQLVDKYLDQHTGAESTLRSYRRYVDKHVRPILGAEKVGKIDAEMLDSFYAELRRCRDHCQGGKRIDHRTTDSHECNDKCRKHVCEPLQPSGIRQIHFILTGAFGRAVKWKWIAISPASAATPPSATPANPHPPSAEGAARIANEAFRDFEWGVFVWVSMTTGPRRGEMCAVRWRNLDLADELITFDQSVDQDGAHLTIKDTKTHQQRHIVLDATTIELLKEHRDRCEKRAGSVGLSLAKDAFVFSDAVDGTTPLRPNTLTQRYGRMVKRLGIKTNLHALRHYSATELIAAGVDVRTVAGRLGHGGGGATTLRVYSAWTNRADQKASKLLAARAPGRPVQSFGKTEGAKDDPRSPYEVIASEVRNKILQGELVSGAPAPTVKQLAAEHEVALSTAHRAMDLLKTWGLIDASRGRRAVVVAAGVPEKQLTKPDHAESPTKEEALDIELLRLGASVRKFRTDADPDSTAALRQVLVDAVKRSGGAHEDLAEYEINVRYAGERALLTAYASSG